ncbi:phenylacetate--CoA ligase family protein [Sabulicella rubraurantiaca]|uniref:phenylacetate--CoA ligase family protein n=1 Tax=Sabulicella rubraurantiaca TaxID=2811429 RepID=UPI001A95E618|nr:AMP-binding protein [Sabulicella rubraurantiaca]
MTDLRLALEAALNLPGWARHLAGHGPDSLLESLPVLRKSELPAMQAAEPPFAGLAGPASGFARLFASPGPIFEGVREQPDPLRFAPAFAEAGIGEGDVVLNCLSYHLTPGGFILDAAARSRGAAVIPAGPGNSAAIVEAIRAYRPSAYAGTPDFLKILLEAAGEAGSSIRKAVVTGAAFPPSLREWVAGQGILAIEAYGTAELGLVAHTTRDAAPGMLLAPGIIVEILRPGTNEVLPEGEVGEVAVTIPDSAHPVIRFSPGDMSMLMPGGRLRGWMGRADQSCKVKGMFVRPEQVAAILRRHPEAGRLRLVVSREGEVDAMELLAEGGDAAALEATLQAETKLRGAARVVPSGTLPRDGKLIADERPVA